MSVVVRESISLQLEKEMRALQMAPADQALCKALYRAILTVQRPSLYGTLPNSVRGAVERWYVASIKANRTSSESINSQLQFAEQLGLKRTRGNSKSDKTAFEFAAERLHISENTVANKAKKLLRTSRRK